MLTASPPPKAPSPMLAQYLRVKEEHNDCLVLFRLGDFFELFFEDAKIGAEVLDIALTRRGKNGEDEIPMCGIPAHALENYIGRLIRAGYKVALCDQVETPEQAKARTGKPLVRREVVRILTPGTLTEEGLLDPKRHNYLLALAEEKNLIAAYTDISTGLLSFEEVLDLPALLNRLEPSEILVSEVFHDAHRETLQVLGTRVRILPALKFDATNGANRLLHFYEVSSLESFGITTPEACSALGVLLEYITLTQKEQTPYIRPPQCFTRHPFLEIDASTRKTLELTQTLSGRYEGSFLWSIDRTATSFGLRLLAQWIHHPLYDHDAILKRQAHIEFFHQRGCDTIRSTLKGCSDLSRALGRLTAGRGGPRDLSSVRDGLRRTEEILKNPLPFDLKDLSFTDLSPLWNALETTLIDPSEGGRLPTLAREGEFIRAGVSDRLDTLRQLRDHGKESLEVLQSRLQQETGITALKIRNNGILGYYVEIPAAHAPKLGSAFIHRQTMAGAMRFTLPELQTLERALSSAASEALELEIHFFEELVSSVRRSIEPLYRVADFLSTLDAETSLAFLAREGHFVKPIFGEEKRLEIKSGRHWGVAQSLKNDQFIPNDVCLTQEHFLSVLTGPNMAGKSTFLRQNALLILLAQMGSFVPATEMRLSLVDRIFSRVGASDDLWRGHSTFMMEMVETATILNQATERSFIILDEIGRGTATFDGMAIAQAVLEDLCHRLHARTLFATHYRELAQLDLPGCFPTHMRVRHWGNQVIFLHQVAPGIADRSYGVHVARLAGLPKSVVERAEGLLRIFESEGAPSALPLEPSPDLQPSFDLSTLLAEFGTLTLDDLTPRQALEFLYFLSEKEKSSS